MSSTVKVPEWLNAGLFEDLLRDHTKDYKEIKEFKVGSALAPGENYSTVMLRITIKVELTTKEIKDVSYMIKVSHQHEVIENLEKHHNAADVEACVYRDVLPEYEELYRKKGVEMQFGPRCYVLPINKNYVLLEDLKPRGFKNASRHEGLDMEHMKAVLHKLAMLHAASAKRVEDKGRFEKKYEIHFFTEAHREVIGNMYDLFKVQLVECLKEYSGHEAYIHKVEKLHSVLMDELFRFAEADPNEFNVLNHGDCWTNNIMFQYDDKGKLMETYLVDHQLPRYASPVIDVVYFIISSAAVDIQLKYFDYFVKFYHKNLVENLKLLGYAQKIPTLKDIHIAILKYGIHAYTSVICVMAIGLLPLTSLSHFTNLFNKTEEGDEFRKLMYSNEIFRAHAEPLFHWLNNRGALDCTQD